MAATAQQQPPGLLEKISGAAFGTYQTAVVRVAIAAIWLAILIRELPNRHQIWGPDAPWGFAEAERALAASGGFSVFGWHSGDAWFELCYLLAIAAAVAMLVGWRTRTVSVLFALSIMSFQHRNEYVLNAGENILRITAIYLIFTRCAQVWSVDARNRRRRAGGRDLSGTALWAVLGAALAAVTLAGFPTFTWLVLLWGAWTLYGALWQLRRTAGEGVRDTVARLGNLVHNGALLLIIAQICLIYAAAGWYKVQGTMWQDGTAVYQSMNIDYLNSWPALTDLLSGDSVIVLFLTYATVLVQVAFPFSLLNRRCKNVLLVILVAEHLGIAFFMGLVFFSLAMIAVDLIFLPTSVLRWVETRVTRVWDRLRTALARPPRTAPPAPESSAAGYGPFAQRQPSDGPDPVAQRTGQAPHGDREDPPPSTG